MLLVWSAATRKLGRCDRWHGLIPVFLVIFVLVSSFTAVEMTSRETERSIQNLLYYCCTQQQCQTRQELHFQLLSNVTDQHITRHNHDDGAQSCSFRTPWLFWLRSHIRCMPKWAHFCRKLNFPVTNSWRLLLGTPLKAPAFACRMLLFLVVTDSSTCQSVPNRQ